MKSFSVCGFISSPKMSAKQKNIFTRSKPLMNIYSGVDHEGKEVSIFLLPLLLLLIFKHMLNKSIVVY